MRLFKRLNKIYKRFNRNLSILIINAHKSQKECIRLERRIKDLEIIIEVAITKDSDIQNKIHENSKRIEKHENEMFKSLKEIGASRKVIETSIKYKDILKDLRI